MNTASAGTLPPLGLGAKLLFYRKKYGLVHAMGSYLGRVSPGFWKLAGSAVTQNYLRNWMGNTPNRIINLGGGSHCIEGCLTVDIDARADAFVDVTQPLPFPTDSVHAIFCEEVIEHVDFLFGKQLLKECWRVLRPGGVIRLTTPDLTWFANRIMTEPEAWTETNSIFYDHGHRCIFTPTALAGLCAETGFVNFRPSSYKDMTSKLGYLDSHADRYCHQPEMSQYLEAEKRRR